MATMASSHALRLGTLVRVLSQRNWTTFNSYRCLCTQRNRSDKAVNNLRQGFVSWIDQCVYSHQRVFIAATGRSYCSAHGRSEVKENEETNNKKELKQKDIFRLLSLAKPEYKHIAGKTYRLIRFVGDLI